jgi:hypothetical protein
LLVQLQASSSNPPANAKIVEDLTAPSEAEDEEFENEGEILAR